MRPTILEAAASVPDWRSFPRTWDGEPWACPRCLAYLVPTHDGRHFACVTREDHGTYVIEHGVRRQVSVVTDGYPMIGP